MRTMSVEAQPFKIALLNRVNINDDNLSKRRFLSEKLVFIEKIGAQNQNEWEI